jgi:hypothetical protein
VAKIRQPIALLLLALSLATEVRSEQTMRSRSGQFLVTGLPAAPRFIHYTFTNQLDYVRLDPASLAVSCERIKERLLSELTLQDAWRGTVNIRIFAVRHDNEPVRFTSVRYGDGWGYVLEVPELISRSRLVLAVGQAVLAELANRKSSEHAAELPAWLLEGISAYLIANNPDLILEPATRTIRRGSDEESLAPVREALRARSALTLDQLSWPKQDTDPLYTHCAHLFVHELLQLRGGRRCMTRMIAGLAEHYNWQTTFLAAFSPHFRRLVDVDKWWALTIAHVTGRDPMSLFPMVGALAQLDQIVVTPMQVRAQNSALPGTTPVKLQTIISEWDNRRQGGWLAQKVSQLQALRLRSPPEAMELIDGYMLTLQNLIRKRMSKQDAIRRLTQLDAQRVKLNPPPAQAGR